MATFKKTLSGDSRYSLTLEVNETSYSTGNNTSNISYSLKATKSSGSGYYTNNTNNPVKVKINGSFVVNTTKKYDFTGSTPKTITLASGTVSGILHNDDGTKTIACSGYFGDANNSLGNATASGNLTLTNIPRESLITTDADTYNVGGTVSITMTRYVDTYTHTLAYSFNGSTTTIFNKQNTLSYSWTIPTDFANSITSSPPTKEATLILMTYYGDTLIGTQQKTITIGVPTNVYKPTVSISTPTEADATMISKNWGVFVQNKSKLSYTITNTKSYNANITSTFSTTNGVTYSGTSVTTSTITNSGTGTITAFSYDTRGARGNATNKTYTVVAYSNPSITLSSAQRCLSNGTLDANGTYIKYSFKASVSSVSSHNSGTYKLCYKKTSDSTYTEVTLGTGTSINITDAVSTFTISTDYEYDIKFTVTDAFTTTQATQRLESGFDLMNFNASGKSMAIGKVSQATASQELLEVGLQTNFEENINASKDVTSSATVTAKRFKTLYLTGGNGNTTGYRKIATFPIGTWTNRRVNFAVASRHSGCGLLCVSCGNNTGTVSAANVYGRINYYGNDSVGVVISDTSYSIQRNSDGTEAYLYWKFSDNDIAMITVLGTNDCNMYSPGYYEINNGEWTTSIPAGLTQIAGTRINFAGNAERDLSGNVITSTYQKVPVALYNSTATTGNIALSDSASNYSFIEIYYYCSSGTHYSSVKIDTPNNKKVQLKGENDDGTFNYMYCAYYTISGSTITRNKEIRWRLSGSGNSNRSTTTTEIHIYKVLGYK